MKMTFNGRQHKYIKINFVPEEEVWKDKVKMFEQHLCHNKINNMVIFNLKIAFERGGRGWE